MKKSLCILLSLLLIFSLFSNTSAFAELKDNPEKFLKKVKSKLKSIRSIRSVVYSSIVKGKVILFATKRLSLLPDDLRSILTGRTGLKRRKKIEVSGTNIDDNLDLEGLGRVGRGYFFRFGPLVTEDKRRIGRNSFKLSGHFPSVIEIGFGSISSIINTNFRTDRVTIVETPSKRVIKANFRKIQGGKTIALGRFILKSKAVK